MYQDITMEKKNVEKAGILKYFLDFSFFTVTIQLVGERWMILFIGINKCLFVSVVQNGDWEDGDYKIDL